MVEIIYSLYYAELIISKYLGGNELLQLLPDPGVWYEKWEP